MVTLDRCVVSAGRGLTVEPGRAVKRGVTLLSAERWQDVCLALSTGIPWYARRANLLIQHFDLASAIGRTLRVGGAVLRIHGETKPCALMDSMHPGLRAALVPDFGGGVHGEVLEGGEIGIGDPVCFTVAP